FTSDEARRLHRMQCGQARVRSMGPGERDARGRFVARVTTDVSPLALFMRARRAIGRLRAAADGVRYDDRMASDPLVCAAALASLPADVRAAVLARAGRAPLD